MGYFTLFCLFLYLTIGACEPLPITTQARNFRRHVDPPPSTDWELGLREAVHQALLREHYTEPTLRDQLLDAPFLGRHNKASPFGDIAVLARGQLYITSEGFKFVQDSDEEQCTDCNNPRCVAISECLWHTLGHHHKLLSLWTVKRIRHRDPQYGHVFEIEYTISPITSAVSEDIVKRHGYFNYNIPGHIFVIRSNPRLNSAYYLNGNKWNRDDRNRDYKEPSHFKPGILIGVTPDGYKQVLQSFPGFYSSYHPQHHYNDHTTIDPKEYELYKKLIESLASKTSHVPHRFSVTTPTTDTTSKPSYHLTTTYVPVPQTTYVQFSDGQIVPITENILQPTTVRTTPIKSQPTQVTKYSEPDLFYQTVPSSTPRPLTTLHYYTPIEQTSTTRKSTTKSRKITTLQDLDDYDIFSTARKTTVLPLKTTQAVTSQVDQFELFPVSSTEPMQPVTERPKSTDSITEQLPPPDGKFDTTVPYSTATQPSTVTREKSTKAIKTTPKATTFAPSPREEITTVIEKVPYTEERTTVILPTTQEQRSTTPIGHTTQQEKTTTVYVVPTIVPTTSTRPHSTTLSQINSLPSTVDRGTTPVFTVTPYTHPNTQRTTFYTKPTTLFEYAFDSTTKPESLSSKKQFPSTEPTTLFTVPSTNRFTSSEPTGFTLPSTNKSPTRYTVPSTDTEPKGFPSKEPTRFTIPTTTHYYYTFDSETPQTSDGTTPTQPETTTIKLMTESEKSTTSRTPKVTTTKGTISRVTSTTPDDFLIDPEIGKPVNRITDPKKDFNEDDIFGKAPLKTTQKLETTSKKTVQSDIDKALFGGRRSKQLKLSAKVTRRPPLDTTKIIYENFFTPTSTPSVDFKPSTDQSYSTSISFQVNRRNGTKSTTLYLEPTTIQADLSEVVGHNGSYKVYKAELPQVSTTEKIKSETKKVFDDVALQLVNHARSIDYLQRKSSRQPKYRRRSFSTRRKGVRKVNTKDDKSVST